MRGTLHQLETRRPGRDQPSVEFTHLSGGVKRGGKCIGGLGHESPERISGRIIRMRLSGRLWRVGGGLIEKIAASGRAARRVRQVPVRQTDTPAHPYHCRNARRLEAMSSTTLDPAALADSIKEWGRELGFQQVGITGVELGEHEAHLERWLAAGYHGEMDYMAAHGSKRSHPEQLVPGTLRVVSLRMDYLPGDTRMAEQLAQPEKAYVSRYALGRDYHKLIRKRLQQLAERVQQVIGPFGFRAFVDSAPVLEKAVAQQAGLGWIGKNTLVLNRKAGSWFFLGELFVDIELPVDEPTARDHCGSCHACLDICPTEAFVGERVLDARRCISYLTIELKGPIPVELRSKIGNLSLIHI